MFSALRRVLHPRPVSPPHSLSTANFPVIEPFQLIEEERIAWYDPKDFYPVQIGVVFQSRYQVVGKLGYGGYATVWLCRDLVEHCYVTVKVCSRHSSLPVQRELAALKHLSDVPKIKHSGPKFIRTLLDHFELTTDDIPIPSRPFQCFVFKPMATSVWAHRRKRPGQRLPERVVKDILEHVLFALDYLHEHAKVIHTDIQEKNLLFSIDQPGALEAFEDTERTTPTPRKVMEDRAIYLSRQIGNLFGRPSLCDFGEARFGSTTYTGLIQPDQYRAPEVILGIPWNEKVDIWSVGIMIWHMFEGKNMINVTGGPENEAHNRYALAHMVSLLGPPHVDLLKRSVTGEPWQYFNTQGNWIHATPLPDDSLEVSEENLQGEHKAQFLTFVRKMLQWKPEDRLTAKELLNDPWLKAP